VHLQASGSSELMTKAMLSAAYNGDGQTNERKPISKIRALGCRGVYQRKLARLKYQRKENSEKRKSTRLRQSMAAVENHRGARLGLGERRNCGGYRGRLVK